MEKRKVKGEKKRQAVPDFSLSLFTFYSRIQTEGPKELLVTVVYHSHSFLPA